MEVSSMMNRKALGLLGLALGVVFFAVPVQADESAHALTHVYVQVQPTISVNNGTSSVDLGTVQLGVFCATIRWRIDANTEAVQFCVAASDLYKGDDPNSSVPPLPLYLEGGVEFDAEAGNPVGGASPIVDFTAMSSIQTPQGIFPSYQTDYLTIESSQFGVFSQYVDTYLCWYQPDPEQPRGEYSGWVALWAFVVPSL
jgi:hypothetical protein